MIRKCAILNVLSRNTDLVFNIAPFVFRQMIDFSKYTVKPYKHIDKKISFSKVKDYVLNPDMVSKHSFLPFIHHTLIVEKFIGHSFSNQSPIKEKSRAIYYAGHLDSYIYRYYSDLLNEVYNQWVVENGLDKLSVAYRTNKIAQSSINFSANAIAKIVDTESSLIVIGDFESYFDTLDHTLLKNRLKTVLSTDYLSKDWHNVFKSLTKFGYVPKEKLEELDTEVQGAYFNNLSEFRVYQKEHKVCSNPESFGIPQGSPISGVLANVYAIDFDREMAELAQQYEGYYQRYSDDFILILPIAFSDKKQAQSISSQIVDKIEYLANENRIRIQKTKLNCALYHQKQMISITGDQPTHIDYLGFTFDGYSVKMRQKSIGKFYRKARRLIRHAHKVKIAKKMKKLPYRHKIYSLYTDFGVSETYRSNFIDYAKRAQRIFDNISPKTKNVMMEQLKNRKKIIEKELGYRIHSKIEE